jgi:hypothetical protein
MKIAIAVGGLCFALSVNWMVGSTVHAQQVGSLSIARCLALAGVMEICDHPKTLWVSPDLKPDEAAQRFLDALKAKGFTPK